jgi:hypothetical protein
MIKHSTDWLQITIFTILCAYPFFARNIDHSHDKPTHKHPIIEFLHGGVVLGCVIGFLFVLILLDIYQLSQGTTDGSRKFGLVHTIGLVSKVIGDKIVPEKNNGFNEGFRNTMKFVTGHWMMFALFLWSVSHYPGLFWKDIWWVNILVFFLPYLVLTSIVGYSIFTLTTT